MRHAGPAAAPHRLTIRYTFCSEDDPGVSRLRARLKAFYDTTTAYEAFAEPNWKPEFWSPVRVAVQRLLIDSGHCSVLEFGAGRTSFGEYLGPLRHQVRFDVQDVTGLNVAHLSRSADKFYRCELTDIDGSYDIIFSTFVWEHLTAPRAALTHLLRLLAPRGALFLACPRYEFPFYMSPSIRHNSGFQRAIVALWLLWRRSIARITRRGDFLIHLDPAVFHRPWFRDSDAVHWVSRWDLACSIPAGWVIRDVRIPTTGPWHWFWARFLLMFVVISREGYADALGLPS